MWNGSEEIEKAVKAALPNAVKRDIGKHLYVKAIVAVVIIVGLVSAGIWGWGALPISTEQEQTIKSLVRMSAERHGLSSQAGYARLHRQHGVRRTEDIRRRDYDQIIESLSKETR